MDTNEQFLAKKRADVQKQAEATMFRDTTFGKTVVGWYNAEIARLTDQLINDKSLDESLPKLNLIKGELRAYALITNKLRLTDVKGEAAQATLAANEPEQEEEDGAEQPTDGPDA